MTTAALIPLIPIITQVVLLGIAAFIGYWVFVVKVTNRVTTLEERCSGHTATLAKAEALHAEVEKMKADNLVFWRVIEPHLGRIIHSPVNVDRDELVEKLISGTLDTDEATQLTGLLRKALGNDDWPAEKRLAASLLLARLLQMDDARRVEPSC